MVNAIEYVSGLPHIVRMCYQLADPAPLTITVIARATGRRVIRIPLTRALAKFSIEHIPGVYPLLRIPSPAVDYFVHPTTYAYQRRRRAQRLGHLRAAAGGLRGEPRVVCARASGDWVGGDGVNRMGEPRLC